MDFQGAATRLARGDLEAAAAILNATPEALWAVAMVESSGRGFLPDRRPKLLYERHLFRRLTGGRYDQHTEVSGPPGGYGAAGAHQYDRLQAAIALDRKAALESASWGLGQTLGLNHAAAGYPDVEAMVADYVGSEAAQLTGLARFIAADVGMAAAIRQLDWPAFARRYNGPAYAENHYDRRLAEAYAALIAHGLPDWSSRKEDLRASLLPPHAGGGRSTLWR